MRLIKFQFLKHSTVFHSRHFSAVQSGNYPRDHSQTFPAAYNPEIVERGWYEWWQSEGHFSPSPRKKTFTMILPPPNVTGQLHIGHALTVAVQDAIARWKRMSGFSVQWIPGLDHAGIATQSVVEKKLSAERDGLTRHDLGREAFLHEVWNWNDEYGGRILGQLRNLGASLDWGKQFFTMDEQRSKAVIEAFVRLSDKGLIYRGKRMSHWCPHLKTAISDIEVEYRELDGPTMLKLPGIEEPIEFGVIETFAYPIDPNTTNGSSVKEIEVATTRLETMLGDAAVVVHPDCPRLGYLAGCYVLHPLRPGVRLPVIADAELVD
eukprot:g3786.t1